MKNKKQRQRGSFTVEAALIFPVILLTVLGIFYLSIVHYQNISAATAAMRTASRVSYAWNTLGDTATLNADGTPAAFDFSVHDPYRYFIDTKKGNREKAGAAYMMGLMGKSPELFGTENESTGTPVVQKTGGLLQKYVLVTIEKTYTNPLGNLAAQFGMAPKQRTTLTAKAPLVNPGEFIRNVSFIYDTVESVIKPK